MSAAFGWGVVPASLARARVLRLATPLGYFLAQQTGGHFQALINGFAAGALLVLLWTR